jgi:hypothetical protein
MFQNVGIHQQAVGKEQLKAHISFDTGKLSVVQSHRFWF